MILEDTLTCKELVMIITEYVEGVMPQEERARFELHLSNCPGCEIYLEQMRQTIQVLGRLDKDSLSTEAEASLLSAFRGFKRN